jgi:hypothetical protein
VSIQPDEVTFQSLKFQRVWLKFLDLASLGWALEKHEARGLPLTHESLHRMADQWKKAHE